MNWNPLELWLKMVSIAHAKAIGFLAGFAKLLLAIGGLFMTIVGFVWTFVDLNGGLDGIATSINQAAALIRPLPVAPVLHAVNRVFPLNEIIVMEATLLTVYVTCVVIRWIIAWVPGGFRG